MTELANIRAAIQIARSTLADLGRRSWGRDQARATLAEFLENVPTRRTIAHVLRGDPTAAFKVQASPSGIVNLAPPLVLLFGADALAQALDPYIVAGLPESIAPEVLARRVADAEARLLELEHAEEIEVSRLESLGQQVDRRGDARPEIVLALRSTD